MTKFLKHMERDRHNERHKQLQEHVDTAMLTTSTNNLFRCALEPGGWKYDSPAILGNQLQQTNSNLTDLGGA